MFFGLFESQQRKTRRLAADWLELAEKVFNYRRDVLPEADLAALNARSGELRRLLAEKADGAKLKLGTDALEAVLRRTGGTHYPKSGVVENIEFLLVAAIVILGLRAFYVQPFKIPTNSMWPSYYGMTGRVYASKADEPGSVRRAINFAAVGASHRGIDSPDTGEVLLPIANGPSRGLVGYSEVAGRSWLVLPAKLNEYRLLVGSRVSDPVRVPSDFDMDWVLRDTFFPEDPRPFREIAEELLVRGRYVDGDVNGHRTRFLRTGKTVRAGERLLSFDILTGDQLFVDRVSYHFVRPEVGDGFVFRTGNIPQLARQGGDQYYIKRLVGLPGDTLRIEDHTLYRNGEPITGAAAFDKNARQAEHYVGYRQEGSFRGGAEVRVGENQYMALGDNSANSLDGRYWGTVPAKDVVGRPLFIYYPFTTRWGPAP